MLGQSARGGVVIGDGDRHPGRFHVRGSDRKNPAVFVARTRFAWLPVPIRASRTPLVTVPDFFTPSSPRASRRSLVKRPVRAWRWGQQSPVFSQTLRALALSGARRRPPFAIPSPCNWLKTAARAGETTPQQHARRLAKNHNASETNLTPYSARKGRLAGRKHGLAVG